MVLWMDPAPDLIHIQSCGSAGNRIRDLVVNSQTLRSLDQLGGIIHYLK